MISIGHVVHPVEVGQGSDLNIAQPVTFESMRRARDFASGRVAVGLYAVQYSDEKCLSSPEGFIRIPDLTRSVADFAAFQHGRKLALIGDILDRLAQGSSEEYLIYSNVDIALQPHFYLFVAAAAENGYDAFVINRRTIFDRFTDPARLPAMYAEIGDDHKGYDCFVFRRQLLRRLSAMRKSGANRPTTNT